MATEPDQIRSQIEVTRSSLASNVDELADRTSPGRIMNRGWRRVTDRMHSIGDRVMGAPSSATGSVKDIAKGAGEKMSDVASEAADAVREAPHVTAEQTRGNPLAAGLIAFGAGLLAAAMIPETEAERRLTRQLADSELADQVREPLRQSVSEVGRGVSEEVKETGARLADTAKEHATQAVDEARAAGQQSTTDASRNRY